MSHDIDRIRQVYSSLETSRPVEALSKGREGYTHDEIWTVIVEEARSRGLDVEAIVPREGSALLAAPPPRPEEIPQEWHLYRVYQRRTGARVAVKDGFTWPGFFFLTFWALYRRLWLLAVGLFLSWWITYGIVAQAEDSARLLGVLIAASLFLRFIVGATGNEVCAWSLKRRGFALAAQVWASSRRDAVNRTAPGAQPVAL